jgi:transposase
MNKSNRRKFSAEFKTKVVIEALKERNTIEELAKKYELHPVQISQWKASFLENASSAFDKEKTGGKDQSSEKEMEKLYEQIGRQKIEIDWLKKKLQ